MHVSDPTCLEEPRGFHSCGTGGRSANSRHPCRGRFVRERHALMIDFVIETEIARRRRMFSPTHRRDQARYLANEHGLRGARACRPDRAWDADPRGAPRAGRQRVRRVGRGRGIRTRSGIRDADHRGSADPRSHHRRAHRARHSLWFRVYGQPTGVMRVAEPVLRPMMKRSFAGYCATLKRVLENASCEP